MANSICFSSAVETTLKNGDPSPDNKPESEDPSGFTTTWYNIPHCDALESGCLKLKALSPASPTNTLMFLTKFGASYIVTDFEEQPTDILYGPKKIPVLPSIFE